jgi:hypothetical protein
MRHAILSALSLAVFCGFAAPSLAVAMPAAPAEVKVAGPAIYATVSISRQQMDILVTPGKGEPEILSWKVSTGRKGHETPTGSYKPTWLDIDHRSKAYDDTPMPFAVFFHEGYAVHATEAVTRLGRPASHGCVRLSPKNAHAFYDLVASYGRSNTQIVIVD